MPTANLPDFQGSLFLNSLWSCSSCQACRGIFRTVASRQEWAKHWGHCWWGRSGAFSSCWWSGLLDRCFSMEGNLPSPDPTHTPEDSWQRLQTLVVAKTGDGGAMLLASGGKRPGMLLGILPCTGQQRSIPIKTWVIPRLGNSDLEGTRISFNG